MSYMDKSNSISPVGNEDDAILLELNKLGSIKPILRVKDMIEYIWYKIVGAKKVATKFGNRVVLQLENYQLFLPTRYESLSEETISELNRNIYSVANKGKVLSTYNLEFYKKGAKS